MIDKERLTVCILEGEPELPDNVNVVAGLSGTWNTSTAHSIGMNLTLAFNMLRSRLSQRYGMKIPTFVLDKGKIVYSDEEVSE